MRLKPGVKLSGLSPQIVLAAIIVNSLYEEKDTECVLTSCNDGTHKSDSFHYRGEAIDVRTKNYFGDKNQLRDEIKLRLGADFDVILEDSGGENEHLHIEYDPK